VHSALERLPNLLDRVDGLLDEGTIGATAPNAADFQILSSVRVLLEFEDLAPLIEGRPCAPAARLLFPGWAGPIPRGLPACSLPRARGGSGALS
jgi:glutathione S-transferase